MGIKHYCELKFPDGKTVTGMVKTESLNVAGKVKYTGPKKRLNQAPELATPSFLHTVFKETARGIGAGCELITDGVPFG